MGGASSRDRQYAFEERISREGAKKKGKARRGPCGLGLSVLVPDSVEDGFCEIAAA
jgi:hypothetical protein